MNDFFLGKALYGDNFNEDEIKLWFDYEKEAYAELGAKNKSEYTYYYHSLNIIQGFNYLPKDIKFNKVLGVGSAYGDEFMPIANQIDSLYILEPSDQLVTPKILNKPTVYVKPNMAGNIDFDDSFFDLIVCIGTIHHIPNVTYVLSEMIRTLKPGGYLLLREPINSMGDWRTKRKGLTTNERGIPLSIFRNIIKKHNLTIVNEGLFFTMNAFFVKLTKSFLKKPLYAYPFYIHIDKLLSKIFAFNIHYHATKKLQRIAPAAVFYVLRK